MRFLLIAFVILPVAAAQVSPPAVITERMREGRRLIGEAIEALGGDAFLNVKTKIETGRMYTFYNRQLSGLTRATVYTRYLVAPEHPDPKEFYMRERISYGKPNKEKWAVLFNEDDGYEITFRGIRPLGEDDVEQYRERRRKDIFYILLRRMGEKDLIFERAGREVIDNQPVEVVDILDASNEVVKVYLHYTTKLPRRQSYIHRGPDNVAHEITTIFDNFKDAGGGAKLPMVVQRQRDGERVFSMFATSVEVNKPVGDDLLGLPAKMKMLERAP